MRKLTIIAPFIPRNNLLFYFFLNQKIKKKFKKKRKKRDKKIRQILFIWFFETAPKKGAKGDAVYNVSALKVFLKRMKQKRPLEKQIKNFENEKKKKNRTKFFCFNLSKLPPKSCPGRRRLHLQRPQSVLEEDEAEEAAESFVKCWFGVSFFFYFQLSAKDWDSLSWFTNTGIERQHQYLSYELFEMSVTLFIRILWIDSHSWWTTPIYINEQLISVARPMLSITVIRNPFTNISIFFSL